MKKGKSADAPLELGKMFQLLFENIMDGAVLHRLIVDKKGKPVDYVLEKMNPAAEKILSMKKGDVEGRRATEVYNGDTPFIERYARVAKTCKEEHFIDYYAGFNKWYEITSFCPKKGYFINIFRDITERKKTEEVREAIYKISEAAHSADNLNELYSLIHHTVSRLMPARNFYIALYNDISKMMEFEYWVDEVDPRPKPRVLRKGITEYVFYSGKPLIANPDVLKKLQNTGKIKTEGSIPVSWLGVPLKTHIKTIGVLAVQSYSKDVVYTEEDKNILKFVSRQIAMAIERKKAERTLKHLNAVLYSIRKINQLISREKNVEKLIQSSCKNLVENHAYYGALIGLLDKSGKITSIAKYSSSKECLDVEKILKDKLPDCVLQAMKQREAVIIKNPSTDCGECPLKDKCKNGGTVTKRLNYKGKIYGFICIKAPGEFIDDSEELSLFNEVSGDIAFALYRIGLEEKAKKTALEIKHLLKVEHSERLRAETLAKIALTLTSKTSLSDVFKEILKQAKRIVPNTSSNIALLKGNALYTVYTQGYEKYNAKEYVLENVQSLDKYKTAYEIVRTKKPLIIFDTTKDPRWVAPEETPWVRSYLSVPIYTHNKVLGVLRIDSDIPNKFTKEDAKKLVPLANAAAIAIENARLFNEVKEELKKRKVAEERLQNIMQDIIYTIAKIVEMKDPHRAGHERRVAQLAVAIAKEMGLPKNKIEGLRVAALLHDVGVINTPSEILTRPSKLTKLEYAIVKNHSKDGYEILKNINFPWPVSEIVLQHHERMNGSGYPQGLTGKDIMLEARILSVADVVEAMCSDRPHRPALGIEEALKEIEKNKGILYDEKVVDICIKLFKEKGFKFEKD